MQTAAAGEPTLSHTRYQQWQRTNTDARPLDQIHRRFGWTSTLKQAGLKPQTNPGNQQFSNQDLDQALQAADKSTGTRLTKATYTKWRTNQTTPTPSVHTIAYRNGNWTNALRKARIK